MTGDEMMSERKANRLIHEKSPYLLQHAHNPVDWFAWGQEAFDRAEREDKPVILSIGYSTCHWCHVMEHESFENDQMAALMNEHFISIKVDREERPDLDQIYMTAVTAITGQGGWPLTVFLTPDKKPFYGGTYFPPHSRWGHPGFTEVLTAVNHSWKNDRGRVVGAGIELTEALRQNFKKSGEGRPLDGITLDTAYHQLQSQFDPVYGGFGQAPKFPMGHNLSFLLRYWKRTGRQEILDMATQTLTRMAQGGMYDQLGGGFHRYSTDQTWHVPHFEKMLYDQALLVRSYLEAYQITREPFFARITTETLDYVLRDLCGKEGGFYSAEDADSIEGSGPHKKEGAFYVWSEGELKTILGEDAAVCSFYFGAEPQGNAQNDPHQEFTGKNILFVAHSVEETARHFKKPPAEIEKTISLAQEKLLEARKFRSRPHLDDKVLVDWNGLMISGFALAAVVLDDARYRTAARRAADFILTKMLTAQGRLLHRYREGDAAIVGTLEDYAFLTCGLLDLYEATFDLQYLKHARQLTDGMLDLFWDSEQGGFFLTGRDAEELIARPKEIYDGALPSGNSVAALVLLRMYHLTGQALYQQRAQETFQSFALAVGQRPSAYGFCLMALDFAMGPVTDVVLAGRMHTPEWNAMHQAVYKNFSPNKVVVGFTGQEPSEFSDLVPLVKDRRVPAQGAGAYVCQDQACRPPVFKPEELEAFFINVQPVKDK
jgi:uncharacterized protein